MDGGTALALCCVSGARPANGQASAVALEDMAPKINCSAMLANGVVLATPRHLCSLQSGKALRDGEDSCS